MAESIMVTLAVILGAVVLLPATVIFAVISVMLLTILFSVGFGGPIVLGQELGGTIMSWVRRRQNP